MKLNYQLDISPDSYNVNHTPGISSQRLPFFIHSYGHFYTGPAYCTEREDHDNYLIIYTLAGEGLLRYRGADYPLGPGQVFLIHCLEYQLYRTGESGQWEIKWLHFNGPASPGYFELINGDRLRVVTLANPMEFGQYLDQIPELIAGNSFRSDNEIALCLTKILTVMVKDGLSSNQQPLPQYLETMNTLIAYLQEHYMENVRMGEVLGRIPLSQYHFSRLFKKYTGYSPYGYLIHYRIHNSKRLLQETDLSVKEVAFRVGFNDVNNYIREFKKLVGTTPVKYRKLWI